MNHNMRVLLGICLLCGASALGTVGYLLTRLLSPTPWSFLGLIYVIGVAWLTSLFAQSALESLLDVQKPLSVSSVDSYISMARDVGLLRRSKPVIQTDQSDAVQCEVELLLGELHAILITGWFDSLSPRDADFPRASRVAFSRAAVEVETCIRKVNPVEAARAVLILAIGHARRIKGGPWPKTDEEVALNTTAEALVMSLLPPELCCPPTGPLLSALLAHGALSRALSLVADPGWLQTQIAWALGGQTETPMERPRTLTLSKVTKEEEEFEDPLTKEEEAEATPEYEEASDLASSIAKLRALLAAKDEAEKASELPNDDRPFMNLSIVGNEVVAEGSGMPYVLYCVQYEVVVMGDGGPRLAVVQVKRRFQEFLNLQSRLEEQPHLKAALRGVKGPSKWLALAFSKAGQQTTAQRQPVLERYLQQLCEQPVLARCEALQSFLAYGSPTAMAYTRGSSERLDRLLARTVSDVFHTIKTALPNFEDQIAEQTELNGHFDVKHSFMERPPQLKEVSRDVKRFLSSRVVEAASEALPERPSSPLTPIGPNPLPQASLVSLTEVLVREIFPSCWLWKSPLLGSIKILLSHWLEHRLQTIATDLWSSYSALVFLRLCRIALAPGPPLVRPTREEGHRALASVLVPPTWLSIALGKGGVTEGRDLILRAFACETSNRQLGLDVALLATFLATN
ncbi:uncharacterized protein LOC132193625 [Neocloeon triangulifer]|uniref:uncharacterized protein LOC132193625 n=1 Tax=Neocloeon triangulifer TaxID=2078957 RepID=UPI00286EE371|nr:uncharacterized protein LOC132193625 [Neocloeon triangulifer]